MSITNDVRILVAIEDSNFISEHVFLLDLIFRYILVAWRARCRLLEDFSVTCRHRTERRKRLTERPLERVHLERKVTGYWDNP